MAQRDQIFRCNVCGQTVKITVPGTGSLICCDQMMVPIQGKAEAETPIDQPRQPIATEPVVASQEDKTEAVPVEPLIETPQAEPVATPQSDQTEQSKPTF